jgi:hypothetical protein
MKRDGDHYYLLSTGRRFFAPRGLLSPGPCPEVVDTAMGEINEVVADATKEETDEELQARRREAQFTAAELHEIAAFMVEKWQAWPRIRTCSRSAD